MQPPAAQPAIGQLHAWQITLSSPDGASLMEGMKFSMTGWWEIKLAIESAAGQDTAVFNTVIDTSGAKR